MDVRFIKGKDLSEPFEYFCHGCGQLRLCFVKTDACNNCNSFDIVKGKPGSLDKEQLKKGVKEKCQTKNQGN